VGDDDGGDNLLSFDGAHYALLRYKTLTVQRTLIPPHIYSALDQFILSLPFEPRPQLSDLIGQNQAGNEIRIAELWDIWAFVEWVILYDMILLKRVVWLPLMN
jgi:hypothetical protein